MLQSLEIRRHQLQYICELRFQAENFQLVFEHLFPLSLHCATVRIVQHNVVLPNIMQKVTERYQKKGKAIFKNTQRNCKLATLERRYPHEAKESGNIYE